MNGWMDEEFGLRGDILLPPGNDHWVVGNELVIAINFIGLDFEKKDKFTLIFVNDFKIKKLFSTTRWSNFIFVSFTVGYETNLT